MKNIKMKRTFIAGIVGILVIFVGTPQGNAGIFGPSADTKKNVAAVKALSKTETSLVNRYSAVTGKNYKDDYTTGMVLVKLLPDVNIFITKIEALSPQDSKLASAIALWGEAWNKYSEGITLNISAIDSQDYSKVAQGNAAMSAARALEKRAMTALAPFLK